MNLNDHLESQAKTKAAEFLKHTAELEKAQRRDSQSAINFHESRLAAIDEWFSKHDLNVHDFTET